MAPLGSAVMAHRIGEFTVGQRPLPRQRLTRIDFGRVDA